MESTSEPHKLPYTLQEFHDGLFPHVLLSVCDLNGIFIEASEKLLNLCGYRREELIGQNYGLISSGHHPESFFNESALTVRSGQSWSGEICSRRKDGRLFWVFCTITPLRDANSDITRFLTVYSDITTMLETDTKLQETQQTLLQIIDSNPVPTFVIDAEHRVTHWNRACEIISGVKAKDMIGSRKTWSAFYPQERPVMADLIVDQVSHTTGTELYHQQTIRPSTFIENAYEAEGHFPTWGESGRWLFFTAAPLYDTKGQINGAIETLQDFTARKNAEDSLRQTNLRLEEVLKQRTEELQGVQEQLMQSDKLASIGQLAAGVAHEINNPIGYVHSNIGTLDGYIENLFTILDAYAEMESKAPCELPGREELEQTKKKLDLIYLREDIPQLMNESKEGISRVRKIVQDLKDFSHADTSQEWRWANILPGIESTLNVVHNEIKYKADVVKEFGPIPDIECLPSQLNQVFMNLLVNAAHAIPEGQRGTITLRSGCEGGSVWVEVSDTGAGISPAILKRIFDPFFTTKPVGKGTGLGLSLSYGIVQKHNGRIDVNSVIGQGTTFRITLPIQNQK